MKSPEVTVQPLAEVAEPALLAKEIRKYETRRNPEGLFRSAWNYVECGLSKQSVSSRVDPSLYFEYAQGLIGMTLTQEVTHQDTQLEALTLSTYLPLFVKRSKEEEITAQDCRDVYQSLGYAMSYLQPLDIDEPPQWQMAEIAVLALSARTNKPDMLLYPTSPREEASDDASINHDSYFIVDGIKIPIQQKLIQTDKTYDQLVTILTLQPLVNRGADKSKLAIPCNLSDQMNYLFSLIISEVCKHEISREEAVFLNTLTAAIVTHRQKSLVLKAAA